MIRKAVLLIVISSVFLGGCKTNTPKKAAKTPVLETIDGVEVTSDEFEYVYKKNNSKNENAYSDASIREYLDLYTNFRLKVREAEQLGYDTTKEFKTEFKDYERQLAEPYLTEKSVSEKLVKEAYDRSKKEVNASHLLIMVKADASPEDTAKAYKDIMKYREMIVDGGAKFEDIAKRFSQDPSAKQNGGNLGYFTALQMVYPFENAAFNTTIGQVSKPVRTKFGYHIVQPHDMRDARGQVKVAHIMRRATEGMDQVDIDAAEAKINEIYKKLKEGADWKEMSKQFSEDGSSAAKGGELQWFGAGQMPAEFDEAAFSLTEKEQIGEPVRTAYGFHIIKLIDKKEIQSFDEMKLELENKIKRDSRSQLPKEAFMKRIKKENSFTENAATKTIVFNLADSTFIQPGWSYNPNDEKLKQTLFSIAGQKYTGLDFLEEVKKELRPKAGPAPKDVMANMYKRYTERMLTDYEKAHLAEKYIDYRMLIKEYRDGILLFKLMDEMVWSKAVKDTAGLHKFFSNSKDNYMWDARANATIFNTADAAVMDKVKEELKKGKFTVSKMKIDAITFTGKETSIKDATIPVLDKVIGYMNGDRRLTATINAYTDDKGTDAANMDITQKRADFILKYLTDRGIDANRIESKGMGGSQPLESNKTKEGRAKNNRAEIMMYSTSPKVLEASFNTNNALTLEVTEGLFEKGDNASVDEVKWEKGNYMLQKDGRVVMVTISEVLTPQQKELSECKGLVISDYQNHLEKEWVKELKAKYPVVIYEEEVQKLIKQ